MPELREIPHEKSNRTVPLNFSQPNKLKNRLLLRSGFLKVKTLKKPCIIDKTSPGLILPGRLF